MLGLDRLNIKAMTYRSLPPSPPSLFSRAWACCPCSGTVPSPTACTLGLS